MTPENKKWLKSVSEASDLFYTCNGAIMKRLLTLLIEAEAMREKAEYWDKRFSYRKSQTDKKRLNWTDADWISDKRKELVGWRKQI